MGARELAALLLLAGLAATAARADEWDSATQNDDGAFTDNALFHGSRQQHDLGTHGGLSGKAVSIEPATGLAFDTHMVQQPH